jgi:hypothetical protein
VFRRKWLLTFFRDWFNCLDLRHRSPSFQGMWPYRPCTRNQRFARSITATPQSAFQSIRCLGPRSSHRMRRLRHDVGRTWNVQLAMTCCANAWDTPEHTLRNRHISGVHFSRVEISRFTAKRLVPN